jgi:hypothetical protein
VKNVTAETGGTRLKAEGIIALSPRIDARLNATANRLDLDELMALADAFAPSSAGGARQTKGQSPRIGAGITADEVTAGRVKVQKFVTTLMRDGESIALNPTQFEAFGGRYAGLDCRAPWHSAVSHPGRARREHRCRAARGVWRVAGFNHRHLELAPAGSAVPARTSRRYCAASVAQGPRRSPMDRSSVCISYGRSFCSSAVRRRMPAKAPIASIGSRRSFRWQTGS